MLGVTLGSQYVDTQGYVPALLEKFHGVSYSGTYWLLGGGWFQCRYGGFWMISYYLMFPVVRSFLVFSDFGLKSPASGFQSYSSRSSRVLQLYSTDNKTTRLMVKRFSTVRGTQRGSQLHEEKEREEGDRDEQEEKKGGSRGERQIYEVLCSLCVLRGPDTHRDSQN